MQTRGQVHGRVRVQSNLVGVLSVIGYLLAKVGNSRQLLGLANVCDGVPIARGGELWPDSMR